MSSRLVYCLIFVTLVSALVLSTPYPLDTPKTEKGNGGVYVRVRDVKMTSAKLGHNNWRKLLNNIPLMKTQSVCKYILACYRE